MIEILPVEQRPIDDLSHGDVKLFLFSLGDGWRLPSFTELRTLYRDGIIGDSYKHAWTQEDGYIKYSHPLLPVRDLEDD